MQSSQQPIDCLRCMTGDNKPLHIYAFQIYIISYMFTTPEASQIGQPLLL